MSCKTLCVWNMSDDDERKWPKHVKDLSEYTNEYMGESVVLSVVCICGQ